jgi:hypothetical protein
MSFSGKIWNEWIKDRKVHKPHLQEADVSESSGTGNKLVIFVIRILQPQSMNIWRNHECDPMNDILMSECKIGRMVEKKVESSERGDNVFCIFYSFIQQLPLTL